MSLRPGRQAWWYEGIVRYVADTIVAEPARK